MKKTPVIFVLALTACGTNNGFIKELPDELTSLAAPDQNLQAVILDEEDGCYWYQHVGPVESTMLPLRSKRGRHICTSAETTS